MNEKIKKAIKSFAKSADFCEGVVSSTIAGYGGSGYSVEFHADGSHRVMWDNQIGNLYQSDGIIVGLPQLDTDDIEAPANDKDELREAFSWQADDMEKEFLAKAFERYDG